MNQVGPLPKISKQARRQLSRASTIAAGGKFLGDWSLARYPTKPITLRRAPLPK